MTVRNGVYGQAAEPALAGHHHLPSVRSDLLTRLGRYSVWVSELGHSS
jgi:predicted RNA polymerase sigma factor